MVRALGTFKADSYIRLMDWEADQAAEKLKQTGKITVFVQDNGYEHSSKAVQQKWSQWEIKGLYIFFASQVLF